MISFNPPCSQNVKTHVAKNFLCLIDKHFAKSLKLHKIFNKNNLKVSYSFSSNMANVIKTLQPRDPEWVQWGWRDPRKCNWGNKDLRALDDDCLKRNVSTKLSQEHLDSRTLTYAWQKTISKQDATTTNSLHERKHAHATVVVKHIWELKRKKTSYNFKWYIIKRANTCVGNPSCCKLCISEKPRNLSTHDVSQLNKRSELITNCCHETTFFVTNHRKHCSNRLCFTFLMLPLKLWAAHAAILVWWFLSACNSKNNSPSLSLELYVCVCVCMLCMYVCYIGRKVGSKSTCLDRVLNIVR